MRRRSKKTPLEQACEYAFLLLKYRPRSQEELRQRLKKKFDSAVAKETISFLKSRDFLNDSLFARDWVRARLKKPLGLRAIRSELLLKGVAGEIIEESLREAGEDYREADVVKGLAAERLRRLKGLEPEKAARRLYQYLLRRGFSPEAAREALD